MDSEQWLASRSRRTRSVLRTRTLGCGLRVEVAIGRGNVGTPQGATAIAESGLVSAVHLALRARNDEREDVEVGARLRRTSARSKQYSHTAARELFGIFGFKGPKSHSERDCTGPERRCRDDRGREVRALLRRYRERAHTAARVAAELWRFR